MRFCPAAWQHVLSPRPPCRPLFTPFPSLRSSPPPLPPAACVVLVLVLAPGLGALAVLGDALVLEVVGLLGARDLGRLVLASKSMYCFGSQEELWKGLVIEVGLGVCFW